MNPTKHADFFAALMRPFPPAMVKQRPGPNGRTLDYITARTVMNRLDEVVGPEYWHTTLTMLEHGSVKCALTIILPGGFSLTREDIGVCGGQGFTDAENDQGAASDALKRAAVQFGIGRYLYKDGLPDLGVEIAGYSPGRFESDHQGSGNHDGRRFDHVRDRQDGQCDGPPQTGRALYRWVKQIKEKQDVALLEYLQAWGQSRGFASRMVDWSDDQAAQAHSEGTRRLSTIPGGEVVRQEPARDVVDDLRDGGGPCKIRKGDPNTKLKLEILQLAAQTARLQIGPDASRADLVEAVVAHINAAAKYGHNVALANLRECEDVKLMEGVLETLKANRDEQDIPF